MTHLSDAMAEAMPEADKIFGRMCEMVEGLVAKDQTKLDVLRITADCGLKIDQNILAELQIDPIIIVPKWLPYHIYWPWRPLWCWWWHRYQGWYHCCPYWWQRCHVHTWY